jgi:hypothetical protein
LDILVETPDNNARLVIENKIYAGDQTNQLKRYANHIKDKGILLYLTLDGHEASEESLGGLSSDKYICISYEKEIREWLDECLCLIPKQAEQVQDGVSQYRDLIYLQAENQGIDRSHRKGNRCVQETISF